jgi:hypothetical protein
LTDTCAGSGSARAGAGNPKSEGTRFARVRDDLTLHVCEADFASLAGCLPFRERLFPAPKKSGRTCLAAMAAIYVAVAIGGPFTDVYCLSNDYELCLPNTLSGGDEQPKAVIVQTSRAAAQAFQRREGVGI